MAQETAQLIEALKRADAAGNADDAAFFAQQIRNRRATGGQEEQRPPLDDVDPDPLADIPTEISGVTLSPQIREAMLSTKAIQDPKERRLSIARIAGTIAQQSDEGNFADEFLSSGIGAGIRAIGTGLFGIGDLAAAASTSATGEMSFGEALEAQRAFRHGLEEEFPVTSLVGEVGGAVAGGGAAFKLLSKAPAAVKSVIALQKGQKVFNLSRMIGSGAIAGSITEGITEGEPGSGAAFGAAGGPLGVGLAKAAQLSKAGITKLLSSPSASGIKAMALKLGVTADEMMRRFEEFKIVTGNNPSMADIANPQAAAELREMIAQHAGATQAAREGAERVTRSRGPEIAEQLTGSRVTTTKGAQEAARDKLAVKMFDKADQDTIKFSKGQVENLLNDPDLRDALPRTLKRRLDAVMDAAGDGQPISLSGLDVNDLRKALREKGRGATGAKLIFGELADDVEDIARKQSPAFGEAIDEFAARSTRGEGVEAGRRVTTQKSGEFEQVVDTALENRNKAAGVRVGARSQIEDVARESAGSADRLVKTLSEDGGLVQRLRTILPAREVDRIQEVARLQARAGQNIKTLAPGARASAEGELAAVVDDVIGGIVTATGGAGAGFRANAIVSIISRFAPKISPAVAKNLARDMFDPSKTKQVIAAMRKARVGEEDIIDMFMTAAATAGGSAAAATTPN